MCSAEAAGLLTHALSVVRVLTVVFVYVLFWFWFGFEGCGRPWNFEMENQLNVVSIA